MCPKHLADQHRHIGRVVRISFFQKDCIFHPTEPVSDEGEDEDGDEGEATECTYLYHQYGVDLPWGFLKKEACSSYLYHNAGSDHLQYNHQPSESGLSDALGSCNYHFFPDRQLYRLYQDIHLACSPFDYRHRP